MLRFSLLLVLALSSTGCVSRETMKDIAAKQAAKIAAAKIPAVELSEEKIAKLKELSPQSQIVWLRAGRQSDGKIFVCHVTSGKNLFGEKRAGLMTGTFEPDGSYQRSSSYRWSLNAVLEDCHTRGFDPPVTIKTNYTVMRI